MDLSPGTMAAVHAAADEYHELTKHLSEDVRAELLPVHLFGFRRGLATRLQYIANKKWLAAGDAERASMPDMPHFAKTWGDLYSMWRASKPVEPGTRAYRYLTETRGIAAPVGGFGDDFHATAAGHLLATSWTPEGMLAGGQLVHLVERDGKVTKRPQGEGYGPVKMSMGMPSLGVCTMPGVRPNVVVFAEGPETGASLHSATGYTLKITLGTLNTERAINILSRLPQDRTVAIIAMDDDTMKDDYEAEVVDDEIVEVRGKRNRASSTMAYRALVSRGWDARPVWPWEQRRYDKSDFNDALRERGPEYVLRRVDAVAVGTTQSELIGKLMGLQATDDILDRAFRQITRKIEEYTLFNPPGDDPIRLTVASGVGGGKTELAHRLVINASRHHLTLGDYSEFGVWKSAGMTVPENSLSDEQFDRLTRAVEAHNAANPDLRPLKFGVYRGQGAKSPSGEPMCKVYDLILPLIKAKVGRRSICGPCPHRSGCRFIEQQLVRNDIWLMTTATAYMEYLPQAFGDTTFHTLVIDESMIRQIIKEEQRITAEEMLDEKKCPVTQWGVDRSTDEAVALVEKREEALRDARRKLSGLISSWTVEHRPTPQEFIDAGLDYATVSEALNAEWGRVVGMVEGYEFGSADTSMFAANATADVLTGIWKVIKHITAPAGPEELKPAWPPGKATGWIEAVKIGVRGKVVGAKHVRKVEAEAGLPDAVEKLEDGAGLAAQRKAEKRAKNRSKRREIVMEAKPGIILRGRRHLNGKFAKTDIINLNATFLKELEQLAVDGLQAIAESVSYSDHLHVYQIIDNPVSKAASRDPKIKFATMAATNALALRTGKHGILAGSVELTKWAKRFVPPAVEAANFGRITGNDRWKDGFVVCHAHNLLPAHAAEDAIMAATGESVERQNYIHGDVERLMRTRLGAIVSRLDSGVMHPNQLVNLYAILVDICELIQLLMRARSMRLATAENPHYALFATSTPLNYPVVGLSWWNFINPPHWLRQVTVDGVALQNRDDAAKLYPADMLDVDEEGKPLPPGEGLRWMELPDVNVSLYANPEYPFNIQVFGDGAVKNGKLPGAPSPFDVMAHFEYRVTSGRGAPRRGMALPGLVMATDGRGEFVVSDAKVEAFRRLLGQHLGVELVDFRVAAPRALERAAMASGAHGRFAAGAEQALVARKTGDATSQIVSEVLERLAMKPAFKEVIRAKLYFNMEAGGAQAMLVAASGLDRKSVFRAVQRLTRQEADVLRMLAENPTHVVDTPRARLAVKATGDDALRLLEDMERKTGGGINWELIETPSKVVN